MTEALPHRKIVRAKIARVAVVLSSGIKHTVPLNAVLLIAVTRIINRPIAGRAVRRSMDIADPADLHHAVRGAGLMDDVAGIAIGTSLTVDRAIVRSTDIVVTVDRHHAEAVAISDAVSGDMKEWDSVVAPRLTSRLVRRSRSITELAGMAVVPR